MNIGPVSDLVQYWTVTGTAKMTDGTAIRLPARNCQTLNEAKWHIKDIMHNEVYAIEHATVSIWARLIGKRKDGLPQSRLWERRHHRRI